MRCTFSKEKNLVRAYAIYVANQNNPEQYKAELEEAFDNPEAAEVAINSMITGGTTSVSPVKSSIPVQNVDGVGHITAPNLDSENISSYYIGGAGHMRMQSKFRKSLLNSAVLNIDTMEYINPEQRVSGHTLNNIEEGILKYKNQLASTICAEMGKSYDFISETATNEEYTNIINSVLSDFETYITSNYSDSLENSDAYDSYVILKNFDRLVPKYAPYVDIDNSYKERSEGVHKYSFKATVKHRSNFSKTDNSDITKQIGNLAETILKVIPDIEANGNHLSSCVGVSGFNGSMQTLKKAIMYDNILPNSKEYRESIMGGASKLLDLDNKYNLYNLIEDFIKAESRKTKSADFNEFRQTYLHNKLRGIQQYLFSENTPNYIKGTFVQLFLKTEATGYRAYAYDRDLEAFSGKELRSKMYSTQKFAIQSVISGGLKSLMSKSRVASNTLLKKYDIKVVGENGYEKLIITNKDNKQKMEIECVNLKEATISTETPSIVSSFMKDAFAYYIPDTYENCITNPVGYNWVNDFAPAIALAAKESLRNCGRKFGKYTGVNFINDKVDISIINKNLNSIGQRLSVIFGDSIRSTIKSLGGNSLPLFGQTSLEYNWRTCLDNARKNPDTRYNMQAHSLFWENEDFITAPQVRSEIELNGQIKDPTKLNLNELNRVGILDDFWFPSKNGSGVNDAIYLQNATFSDKARHFLVGYKLGKTLTGKNIIQVYGKNITLKEIIDDAVSNGTSKLDELTRLIRRDKYTAAVRNILAGYAKAIPELGVNIEAINNANSNEEIANLCVAELEKLDNILKNSNLSVKKIRARFLAAGEDFEEQIFAISPKVNGIGNVRVNETILYYAKSASNREAWKNLIDKNRKKFAENLSTMVLSGFDKGSGHQVDNLLKDDSLAGVNHSNFYNKATREYRMVGKDGTLHPIAAAYFSTDILLSQEYNSLTIGEIWAHPNKNSDGLNIDYDTYLEYSEANRLVNQVKRSVIFGSTIHPFGQGTKDENGYYNGVTSEIDIAIIDDMKGRVFTPNGVTDEIDSQDGSGWCTALQSRLENNSELDAAVGENKKTIVHSINPKTGTATLLKWAVYSLTNSVRRNGAGSTANVENLVQKMYSKSLNGITPDLNSIYEEYKKRNEPIFIKDNITLEYKQLDHIEQNGNICTQVFSDGTFGKQVTINTLYDIDQVFGGAWTYKKNENGSFSGTETSVDLLTQTAIKYDLRDKQIAYAVNSSACKVGATNLNSSSAWTSKYNPNDESTKLSTYRISTQFAGVMMNADHELDEAEVTEMSQMISALIEDGHYTDLVTRIYNEIGEIALNNARIQKYANAAKSGDKNLMAQLVGKSLIASFQTGNKDTIGLAQAFMKKAVMEFKRTGVENYNLPFDDATVWGAVIADVTSTLSKLGVRRKYEGFAGVLNPSHNMTQYYLSGNGAMMFDQFNEECRKVLQPLVGNNLMGYNSWQELARNEEKINGKINPFFKPATIRDIDFEDTIVIETSIVDPITGLDTGDITYEEIYIDDYPTYDYIKHLNGIPANSRIYINTACARNLRGADTRFTVEDELGAEIGTFSLYDSDYVRASHYAAEFADKDYDYLTDPNYAVKSALLNKVLGIDCSQIFINGNTKLAQKTFKNCVEECNTLTQDFLEKLDLGKNAKLHSLNGEVATSDDSLAWFGHQECFNGWNQELKYFISNYETRPAEIIMGRYQMEKLGLDSNDHIWSIKDSTYFYNKLKNKYNIIAPNIEGLTKEANEVYDRILYKNGKPILVKVGNITNETKDKLVLNNSAEYNIVGDDLRLESEVVLTDEKGEGFKDKIQFQTIQTSSGPLTYITVDSEEMLNILTNSEYFDDIYLDKSESEKHFYKRLERMAKDRFTAFKKGIEYVGARIPTQAMQSFMPFKVIAFTDAEQNVVYVPKANTHVEGSDYDIDKLYLLAATILENGKIQSGSALQNKVGFETAVRLFRPRGVKYEESLDGQLIPSALVNIVTSSLDSQLTKDNFVIAFNSLANINTRTSANGDEVASIRFGTDISEETKKKFLNLINTHSQTPSYIRDSQEALKTRVFSSIYEITRAAQNQLKAQITVDTCTGELKNTAKNTESGNAEKKVTPYDPSSKYVMQVQNMLGKAVVGIGAVSLKTYFILSTSYNRKCDKIVNALKNKQFGKAEELLNSMRISRPTLDGKIINTTLANINLAKVIREIRRIDDNEWLNKERILSLALEMQENTSQISTPEFLSGIISLAADNAKDLALPKLNATEDLVDIYTTAAMIGISFSEISGIMTSKMFGWMTKAGAQNIFDDVTLKNKVKDMVAFTTLNKIDTKRVKIVLGAYNNYIKYSKSKNLKMASYSDEEKLKASLNDPEIIRGIIRAFEDTNKYKDGDVEKSGLILSAIDYESREAQEERMANADENGRVADAPWTKEDFYSAYRLFKLYQERLEYITPENENKLNILTTLLDYVEEMSTLGRQASINQGLKTDIRTFYNSLRTVEDLINKRIPKEMDRFDFKRFLKDSYYAADWINIMKNPANGLHCFNILEALADSPNFFAMSKIQPIADTILRNVLTIYDSATQIADNLIDSGKIYGSLSDNDFRAITNYITDLNIFTFFKDSNIELDLDSIAAASSSCVTLYETKGTIRRTAVHKLKLNTAQNIASFKHIFENNVLPALKNKFQDNRFLTDLSWRENARLNSQTLALPLQMMDIDSDEGLMDTYAGYLRDFNNIANEPFGGLTVGDWIFLYNLVVNKNSFGQQSLTRIFEDLVDSVNAPKTITEYYKSIGKTPRFDLEEAQEYINKNSKNTKVPQPNGLRINLPSDFTLYLPKTCSLNNDTIVQGENNLYSWRPLGSINPHEALEILADSLNSRVSGLVEVITDDKVKELGESVDSYGFIKNGKVYLNASRYTDNTTGCASALGMALHEVAHLVVAAIKSNPNLSKEKAAYYRLLHDIKKDADYNEIAELYPDRVGSDLDEEILCNKIQKLLANRIDNNSELEVGLVQSGLLLNGLTQLFPGITIGEAINGSLEYNIESFASGMFNLIDKIKQNYINGSQKMAAIKTNLYESLDEKNNLKQDCE